MKCQYNVHVRDLDLCTLHDEFLKAVDAGTYNVNDFATFLRDVDHADRLKRAAADMVDA